MSDTDPVRDRLADRGAYPEVPDAWLRHLGALDAQLAALDPGYRVAQVKEKFGGLRFYLEPPLELHCCTGHEARFPYPDVAADTDPEDAAVRLEQWEAAWVEHEHDDAHQEEEARAAAVRDQMGRVVDAAETASYRW